MGAIRAWAPHRRWIASEEAVLRERYATAGLEELETLLPRAIFTPDQVRSIRRSSAPATHVARELGCHPGTIRDIRAMRTYRDVLALGDIDESTKRDLLALMEAA